MLRKIFIIIAIAMFFLGADAYSQTAETTEGTNAPIAFDDMTAAAACQTLAEYVSNRVESSNLTELETNCTSKTRDVIKASKELSGNYFVFGLSYFLGGGLNLPLRLSAGGRFSAGATVFLRANNEGLLSPTVTGLLNAASGGRFSFKAQNPPSLLETGGGFVFLLGSNNHKTVWDFNGVYTGLGLEVPALNASDLKGRETWSVTAYKKVSNLQGEIASFNDVAIVVKNVKTGGTDYSGIAIEAITINNLDVNGDGNGGGISDFIITE